MLNTAPQIQYSAILDFIYPVGSYFITESAAYNTVAKVQAHFGGTWVQLDDGRFLESVTSASGSGFNKDAGLPNIRGTLILGSNGNPAPLGKQTNVGGAFGLTQMSKSGYVLQNASGSYDNYQLNFSAQNSNSIYSNDISTVQPKSRTVYMYRRTA